MVESPTLIHCDTLSGSMSDEELGLFCSHMNKAIRVENLTIDLLEVDYEIQKITRNIFCNAMTVTNMRQATVTENWNS